jgi:hypothetical protein
MENEYKDYTGKKVSLITEETPSKLIIKFTDGSKLSISINVFDSELLYIRGEVNVATL